MDWTDEDKKALRLLAEAAFVGVSKWSFLVREDCNAMQATSNLHNVADTIASKAVDLVAARGGTMTEDGEHVFDATTEDGGRVWVESTGEWGHEGGNISWAIDALAAHVVALRAAHGARVAVLEAELAKSNKAEFARAEECMSLRERLTSAEEGNRELVRRAQQAEAQRDMWKKEHAAMVFQAKDAREEARALKARCVAGQVPSAHAHVDEVEVVPDLPLECRACGTTTHRFRPSPEAGPFWRCSQCGAPYEKPKPRFPCSATCTHDDAATPGHSERVKERGEAVKEATSVRYEDNASIAYDTGFNEGAEAMRAACLEAVQDEKDEIGLTAYQRDRLKAAIEGAAP